MSEVAMCMARTRVHGVAARVYIMLTSVEQALQRSASWIVARSPEAGEEGEKTGLSVGGNPVHLYVIRSPAPRFVHLIESPPSALPYQPKSAHVIYEISTFILIVQVF